MKKYLVANHRPQGSAGFFQSRITGGTGQKGFSPRSLWLCGGQKWLTA
jgi:hypothetical protein